MQLLRCLTRRSNPCVVQAGEDAAVPIGWAPRRAGVLQAPATLASMWQDIGRVDAKLHRVFMRAPAGAACECLHVTGRMQEPACTTCVQSAAWCTVETLHKP